MSNTTQNLGPALLVEVYTLAAITVILVILRGFYARNLNGRIRLDFILAVLALLTTCPVIPLTHLAVNAGLGKSISQINSTADVMKAIQYIWLTIFVCISGPILSKWSIIALLLEIQGKNARMRRILLICVGGLMTIVGIIFNILMLVQCKDLSDLWTHGRQKNCHGTHLVTHFGIFQGAVNAAIDLLLALWPITIVWNLQMKKPMKVGVCLIMGSSLLPAFASVKRTVITPKVNTSPDPTYDFVFMFMWAYAEGFPVIILGSIPPLRPLFQKLVSYNIKFPTRTIHSSQSRHKARPRLLTISMDTTITGTMNKEYDLQACDSLTSRGNTIDNEKRLYNTVNTECGIRSEIDKRGEV